MAGHDARGDTTGTPAPARAGTSFRNVRAVIVAFVVATTLLWAIDAVLVLSRPGAMPRLAVVRGGCSALFVSALVALLAGAVVGVVLGLPLGATRLDDALWARVRSVWAWLSRGTADEHARRIGVATGAALLLALVAFGSLRSTALLESRIQRPIYLSLGVLGAHALLALGAWLCWPFARMVGLALTWVPRRIPVVRFLVSRTWLPAAVLALSAVVGTVVLAVRNRTVVRMMPWETSLKVAGALVGTAVLMLVARRWLMPWRHAGKLRAAGWGVLLATLLATGAVASSLKPFNQNAREVLGKRIVAGQWAMAVAGLALDFDRDGHLSMLGGGDCAPFVAAVHPGAVDVPDNGVDEDCDGGDLKLSELNLWSKWDYPVTPGLPKNPPIVFITIDAFAARHMKAMGYGREVTPAIDRLAERSVFFTSAFAQGPSTRLSFPSMFTSRWDSMIQRELVGRHPFPIDLSNLTMAEVLQSAGYLTAAVIPVPYFRPAKWKGILQGFDIVDDSPADAYRERTQDHTAEKVTDAAIRLLRKPRNRPLFLWVHYFDAHPPQVLPAQVKPFGDSRQDLYDAELLHVDRQVERLLHEIDESLRGKAMIVMTGDHGNAFDVPRHEKASYGYDLNTTTLHVPLLFHAPFLTPRRVDCVASTLDILPTFVNLLGFKGTFAFQGFSLVPSLVSGTDDRPQVLFHEYFLQEDLWRDLDPLRQVSVRSDRYNLILDRRAGTLALYDWRQDYYERQNLAEKRPDLVKQMNAQLTAFLWHARSVPRHEPPPTH